MTKKTETDNKLTQDELKLIDKIVSPLPELDEKGQVIKKDGKVKLQIPTQAEVDEFNQILSKKQVDVGLVIQLSSLFVNNLQTFTISNLQGMMDTIEVQKRIINSIGEEAGVDVKKLTQGVIKEFQEELTKNLAQEQSKKSSKKSK